MARESARVNILPAGLSQAALLQDLTLSYTVNGGGTSNVPANLIYQGAAVEARQGRPMLRYVKPCFRMSSGR